MGNAHHTSEAKTMTATNYEFRQTGRSRSGHTHAHLLGEREALCGQWVEDRMRAEQHLTCTRCKKKLAALRAGAVVG